MMDHKSIVNECVEMIRRFKKSSYLRDASKLSMGVGFGQIILLVSSPILTRLYDPQDFGKLALFSSCQALLVVFMTCKFEHAIIIEKDDTCAWEICKLIIVIGSVFSLILYIFIWLLRNAEIAWMGDHLLIYLLPVTSWFGGVALAGYFWAIRIKKFGMAATSEAMSRLTQVGVGVTCGVFPPSGVAEGGLMIGFSVCQLVKAIWTMMLRPSNWKKSRHKYSFQRSFLVVRRHWRLCLTLMGSQGLSALSSNFTVFALGALYGDSRLGFYAMATRIVAIPSTLIANAIGDVYRQRAAEYYRKHGRFDDLMISSLKKLAVLAVVPFAMAYLAMPWGFAVLFGENWYESGEYAQILLISSFFSFIITPLDKSAIIVGAKLYIMIWHIVRLSLLIITFLLARQFNLNMKSTIQILVLCQVVLYLYDLYYEWKLSTGKI